MLPTYVRIQQQTTFDEIFATLRGYHMPFIHNPDLTTVAIEKLVTATGPGYDAPTRAFHCKKILQRVRNQNGDLGEEYVKRIRAALQGNRVVLRWIDDYLTQFPLQT